MFPMCRVIQIPLEQPTQPVLKMAFNKISLAIFLVGLFVNSNAYPEGVPPEACASMDPSEGHDGAPSTEPCIYATNPLSVS